MARLTPGLLRRAWPLAGLLAAAPLPAQGDALTVDSVHITVQVGATAARVEEVYWLAAAPRVADFMYRADACSAVGAPRAARGAQPVAFAADTNAPWVSWHDTVDASAATGPMAYRLAYEVERHGARRTAVPIVYLARPLAARSAPVVPRVRLVVEDPTRTHRPTFPRVEAESGTRWSAAMIAIPSVLTLDGPPTGRPCLAVAAITGTNDGFVRRMGLLALTLLLWIPTYFWWATRPRPAEDAS